jgi:hypothetical protein
MSIRPYGWYCHLWFILGNRHACSLHGGIRRILMQMVFPLNIGRICKFAPTYDIFFRVLPRNPCYPRSIFYGFRVGGGLLNRARASCPYGGFAPSPLQGEGWGEGNLLDSNSFFPAIKQGTGMPVPYNYLITDISTFHQEFVYLFLLSLYQELFQISLFQEIQVHLQVLSFSYSGIQMHLKQLRTLY